MSGILVFCSGTGRTGKTVVAEALEKEGWVRLKSPTRDFYASLGVTDENELFSKPQPDRASVQQKLFAMFMEWLESNTAVFVEKNIILERSPLDYLSYLLFHDWSMTLEQYEAYIGKISNFFSNRNALGWKTMILLFPFPTEWMKQPDNDAFRHSKFGKDMTIHALVRHIAGCVDDYSPGEVSLYELEDVSVKDRIKDINEFISQECMMRAIETAPPPLTKVYSQNQT
jgi:hypothetical protein